MATCTNHAEPVRAMAGIIAGLLAFTYPAASYADQAVRQSWQNFAKDPNKVASFRKAVAAMRALNSADHTGVPYRRSWEYWANIHGYFGPTSRFGTVAANRDFVERKYSSEAAKFFDGIVDTSPPDQVAKEIWANCQHSGRTQVNPWFFAWHRLFLLYFEQQLQAASGDPKLRLPYWDYTDPNQLAMPAEFTQPTYKDSSGADQTNPLYEPRRDPAWKQQTATLNSLSTNVDSLLKNEAVFSRYQSNIESNLHAYIHCTIVSFDCPVPDMGAVPYSSNDPIFWIHHANIDRLWSCWSNVPGRKNPTNDTNFVSKSFSFVDAAGQKITKKVGDLFDGALVDYKYEQETNCERAGGAQLAGNISPSASEPAGPLAEMTAPQINDLLSQGRTLSAPTNPVSLSAATTKVTVGLRNDSSDMMTLNALALGARSRVATVTHLILSGITFEAPPGAQFYVYLEDSADPNRREYAGTISFFDAGPQLGPHDHMHDETEAEGELGIAREFDVTDAFRKLSAGKPDLGSVTVSFEATTGRVGSGRTAVINSRANLTVKSIAFQVSKAQ